MPAESLYVANAPEGATLAAPSAPHGPHDDYSWTGSPAVEGLFVVLTILVVPLAIVRWTRRLRLSFKD